MENYYLKRQRPTVKEALFDRPYTTFVQAHAMPKQRLGFLTREDKLEWQERTKNFPSNKAIWSIIYIMYVIVVVELLIGLTLFGDLDLVEVIFTEGILKFVFYMFFLLFLVYMILGMFVHKFVSILLEFVRERLNCGYSKVGEWMFFLIQSAGFYTVIFLFVWLVDR